MGPIRYSTWKLSLGSSFEFFFSPFFLLPLLLPPPPPPLFSSTLQRKKKKKKTMMDDDDDKGGQRDIKHLMFCFKVWIACMCFDTHTAHLDHRKASVCQSFVSPTHPCLETYLNHNANKRTKDGSPMLVCFFFWFQHGVL